MDASKNSKSRKVIHERRLKFSKNIELPKIDPKQSKKLHDKIAKLTHTAQPKTYSPDIVFDKKPIGPNPLAPKPKRKTTPQDKSVDYLAERREFRNN